MKNKFLVFGIFIIIAINSLSAQDLPIHDFNSFESYLNKENDTTYVINFWATWCIPCVKELPEFSEINLGVWQGLLEEEVKKRYKRIYSVWQPTPTLVSPPKGESVKDVCERAITTLQKLAHKHRDRTICVVSNLIVNGIVRCYYLHADMDKIRQFLPELGTWEIIEVES